MSPDVTPEQVRRDPVAFADACLPLNEKGERWSLTRHQRRVLARIFRRGPDGALRFRIVVWSEVKKSGKTFLAAVLLLWWAFTVAHTEVVVAANDAEQAESRVFKTAADLVKQNPALGKYVTVLTTELRFSNGTVVRAVASEYKGAAGGRHSLVVYDELWGFDSERAQRFYEEQTPPPTERDAWVLVVTYAGIVGESTLLEALYQRGLAGTRVDDELECYEADGLFLFWSCVPRMPWQTDAYYAEQRRILRPATFDRLHGNQWISGESRAIAPEVWDACVYPEHTPMLPTPEPFVVWALDAAPKHDSTAVMGVARDDDLVVLVQHRIWTPKGMPLDFARVEAHLRELHAQYRGRFVFDPYQLHSTMMRLSQEGLDVAEYPQTSQNLTKAAETLLDLLRTQRLALYADDELRAQAMNAVVVESSRGIRITKPTAGRKVDAIVALAMACAVCVETPEVAPLQLWGGGVE